MNLINGSLKHHSACVQKAKKNMANDVQSAYTIFLPKQNTISGCVKCVCLQEEQQKKKQEQQTKNER